MGANPGTREDAAMSKPFEFDPELAEDIQQAVDYYHSQNPAIPPRFLKSLQNTYDRIKRQPAMSGRIKGPFRAGRISRFSYAVMYRVRKHVIQILTVHHLRKGSFDWIGRGKK